MESRLTPGRHKRRKLAFRNVGHGEIFEVPAVPAYYRITVPCLGSRGSRLGGFAGARYRYHADDVRAALVDEHGHGLTVEDFDASSGERESLGGKIDDLR